MKFYRGRIQTLCPHGHPKPFGADRCENCASYGTDDSVRPLAGSRVVSEKGTGANPPIRPNPALEQPMERPSPRKPRYQFVWWPIVFRERCGHLDWFGAWGLQFHRFTVNSLAKIYRWSFTIGPLEIRRWQ